MACLDRITPVLDDILGFVLAGFEECDAPGFCRAGIVAGTVAWDDCCDCGDGEGQLWVRLADWSPDPNDEVVYSKACAAPGLLSVAVGALRCVPTLDDSGNAPSAAEETIAAMQVHLDAQLIQDAVMCNVVDVVWGGWVPLGFEGGCGGGEHLYTIPFAPCRCE